METTILSVEDDLDLITDQLRGEPERELLTSGGPKPLPAEARVFLY
jgi:hypothetical protein